MGGGPILRSPPRKRGPSLSSLGAWPLVPACAGTNGEAVLRVRLALRVDDLLELAEHVHAGQHLGEARVRLALLLDRRNELAILELDAVHRDIDLGDVDLVV